MGTKFQSETYFPGYHSARGLNNNVCNGMWDPYREEKTLQNSQNSFLAKPAIDECIGYEKEQLKQTILKQESVFRHQLQELHRLYKKQRDLMNEVTSPFSNNILSEDSKETRHASNFVDRSFGRVSKSLANTIQPPFVFEEGNSTSQRKMFDLELPANLYNEGSQQVDRTHDMTDLNEPIQVEETSLSASLTNLNNKSRVQEELIRRDACKSTSSGFWFSHQGFSQNIIAGTEGEIHPKYKPAETEAKIEEQSTLNFKAGNIRSHGNHTSTLSNLVQVEPRRSESLPFSLTDQAKIDPQGKRKFFGVEISEGNHLPSSNASQAPNLHQSNSILNVAKSETTFSLPWRKAPIYSGDNIVALQDNSCLGYLDPSHGNPNLVNHHPKFLGGKMSTSRCIPSSSTEGLPWVLEKPYSCVEQINGKGSLYHMSLDSLQNHSPHFFKKAEMVKDPTELFSKNLTSLICAQGPESVKIKTNKRQNVTKILGFPVDVPNISNSPSYLSMSSNHESFADEVKGLNNYSSGLRNHIDLNLALNEEESPLPSFSKDVVKIATTEIVLEAPVVLESEEPDSSKLPLDSLTDTQEEIAKVAAEAIMTISSLSYQCLEASASDSLLWFADVISSENVNEALVKFDGASDNESVPEGMDEFEFMTLKLKDTKEEEYCYKQLVLENENVGTHSRVTKRPRRGQGKRGRQRKDFQKDILPSLVSLARKEVTEDLQTFEEVFSSMGNPWESSITKKKAARSVRAKKHVVDITLPAASQANEVKLPPSTMDTGCREVAVEEKSLGGWGKRTRRLPRQRSTNSTSHALAIKC